MFNIDLSWLIVSWRLRDSEYVLVTYLWTFQRKTIAKIPIQQLFLPKSKPLKTKLSIPWMDK